MAIPVRQSATGGTDFEKIRACTTPAVCEKVYDLGLHTTEWKGVEKQQYKVLFVWKTAEKDSKGEHFYVMKKYTNSLAEKAYLRKDIIGWMGRDLSPDEAMGFDFEDMIGKQCTLSIVHSDDGRYANVNSVSQPISGVEVEHEADVPEWIKKAASKQRATSNEDAPEKLKQFASTPNPFKKDTQEPEPNNVQSEAFDDGLGGPAPF